MENSTNINVSEARFYLASRIILQSAGEQLTLLTVFKPRYDAAWITQMLNEVRTCENMPDDAARTLVHEELRRESMETGAIALSAWRALKRYSYDSFSNPEPFYNAAGMKYYEPATGFGFEELTQIMIAGLLFINTHEAALLADENMPATFKDSVFEPAKENFDLKVKAFYRAEYSAFTGTSLKATANRELFRKIMTLCLDAQHVFENNDAIARQFTFSRVCEHISPAGASEVMFELTNEVTNAPVIGEIRLAGTDKMITTTPDGRGLMTQLASGEKVFNIVVDGYGEQTITLTLTGTRKTVQVKMQPLFGPLAPKGGIGTAPASAPTPEIPIENITENV